MGGGHGDKTLPRENLTDEELRDLCITAVRQHRDEMRLWVRIHLLPPGDRLHSGTLGRPVVGSPPRFGWLLPWVE